MISQLCFAGVAEQAADQKQQLISFVNRHESEAWTAARSIWHWAEPGYQETRSCALLADILRRAGLHVEQGVAGIPTALVATAGTGRPVIGILGEFDALPGLSQEDVPWRQPRDDANSYGHGCGHHLFGVAAAYAACALAEQIRSGGISGTVRFYGCPAEEGGSAKVFMVQAGLFDGCDAVLHWHPANRNSAGDKSSLARIAAKFRFRGRPAHAAASPQQGRSALDAVELTNHAAQLLREHTPEATRIHHVITHGGVAPNVVPEFAEAYYYIRHPQSDELLGLYQRLELCAKAGALATETVLEIDYQGGIREILPNTTLAQVVMENLKQLNDLGYTAAETEFALRLQETFLEQEPFDQIKSVEDVGGTVGKGSTDVGDVSWVVPTTGFGTACWVPGTPGHSWQAVACGGTTIARKGMNLAARVLVAAACDLYRNPILVREAQEEHVRRIGEGKYESLMRPQQKPPLDYRKRTTPN